MSLSNSTNLPELQKRHVVLFPFMSKGHTIPLLQLSHLLLRRNIAVTVITTAANRPFVAARTSAALISLPFPSTIAGIPAGVESTDALQSMSLFPTLANATELMKPHFERALESLSPPVTFMVTDGFLWWIQDSATKFNIPRLFFYGMSTYATAISHDAMVSKAFAHISDGDSTLVRLPSFPWIKVAATDFEPVFRDPNLDPVYTEFRVKCTASLMESSGLIVNSFREIESVFADHWDLHCSPKAFCIGPLCLADGDSEAEPPRPYYLQWLDERLERGRSVLYVAFGSQAAISPEQIGEIARGLEESGVEFMWVTREKLGDDVAYEERVRERGVVVREWVDQMRVLRHESVRGFLSHCGWNSVAEGVLAAGVPVLAWPMMAEQPLNARMVTEEMKAGLRVAVESGRFVKWEEVKERVRELMEGERGDDVRANAGRLSAAAKKAVAEGGSSWVTLESLIEEMCMKRTIDRGGPD